MNYKSVGKRRSSALIDLCFSPKRMRIFSINQSFPPRFRLATLDFIPLCLQLQCVPYTLHLECSAPYIPDNNMESYLNKACEEYYLPYHLDSFVYKNIYCAICTQKFKELNIQFNSKLSRGTNLLPTFSALMDFQQIPQDLEPTKRGLKCGKKNHIFDHKLVGFLTRKLNMKSV